jgi:hypothetical protein
VTSAVAVSGAAVPGEPITERVLDWIGGPRWLWILVWAGIMTFVWTYLALLAGVNALGRFPAVTRSVSAGPNPRTRSRRLAGADRLLAGARSRDPAHRGDGGQSRNGVDESRRGRRQHGAVLPVDVPAHRQLAAAKAGYVGLARSLYAQAYEPVRTKPWLKPLQTQAPALDVAQALVERAERVQEWPIDERATAWVAVVVTGVVTSLLVRLVLAATRA